MYWPSKNFISFDTETTGLDYDHDRIIQAAMCVFNNSQLVWQFQWLLNTEYPSHPDAVAVHGLTDEYRQAEGVAPESVFPHILGLINQLRDYNLPLIVFNAPFDLMMLRQECQRFGLKFQERDLYVIDPLVIDRHYQKNMPVFTKPHMRLQQMAARFGVLPPSHDALDDAKTAGYIAIAQSLHYKGVRHATIATLHRHQALWYAEWAKKFRNYANKKGFEVKIPSWPFGEPNAADVHLVPCDVLMPVINTDSAMDSISSADSINAVQVNTIQKG